MSDLYGLDTYAPREIAERVENVGVAKARLPFVPLAMLGMLAGVTAYAEFTPGVEAWIKAGSRGEMTLPTITGIGMGWWTLLFIAILVGGGWGMSRLEHRFSALRPPG